MRRLVMSLLIVAGLVSAGPPAPARAEIGEITIAQQYGLLYLALMVMEKNQILEKHLAAAGLGSTKVSWVKFAGSSPGVDAIISGQVTLSAQGTPSLALLWDRTKGRLEVKGIAALCDGNIWINTRSAAIKSVKDFTEKDRIAIPSLKSSTQAILLQMEAERVFGAGQYDKLEPLIVTMSHPDSVAAILKPGHEVTAHVATSPFHEAEMKAGLHTVTSAYDILGGQATTSNLVTSSKFRSENPNSYAATIAALDEAFAWVNADKRRAAKLYIEMTNERRMSEDEVYAILTAPGAEWGKTPHKVGKLVQFMHHVGTIKNRPESWKDLYFPEAQALAGD
ncbi:MAG: ABC transporter substrate-binding protein [Alphaproteobacteria bacterium]|nr:ABC transporter substrate-binding protein [Alphaproteobacteria bacterium]